MFNVRAEANRTKDFTLTIKSPSGGYVQLEATDIVRVKIGRCGGVVLDLDNSATANGSVVTVTNVGDGSAVHAAANLRLDQGDTGLIGVHSMEVNVVDDSDSDKIKAADYGSVFFEESQDGDVGLS